MSTHTIAIRTLSLLKTLFANLTGNPQIKQLPIDIVFRDEDTASTDQHHGRVTITLPNEFEGRTVTSDRQLVLGLGTHEFAHVPDLDSILKLLKDAQAIHAALPAILNIVEDVRIETHVGVMDGTLDKWLSYVRSLCQKDEPDPQDIWAALFTLRFGYPDQPMSAAIPEAWPDNFQEFGAQVVFALAKAANADDPAASYDAAQTILNEAIDHNIPIPSNPPAEMKAYGFGEGPTISGDLDSVHGFQLPVGKAAGLEGIFEKTQPDQLAIAKGSRMAKLISSGWQKRVVTPHAVGLGRYDARLDARGLTPFVLPVGSKKQLPRKILLCIDTSDSMFQPPCNIHTALVGAVAVSSAAVAIGSQVVLVPFATDYLITHNISEACAIHGGGTSIEWLTSLANRYGEHNVILLTDAQGLEVPPGWTRQHRQRTTVIWIPDHNQEQPPELAVIAQRILTVHDENEIPNLIAISARAAIVSPF